MPRFLFTAGNPGAVIDVSVIFSTVIGLALPATLLYYAVALLVCKLVFDRQVGDNLLLPLRTLTHLSHLNCNVTELIHFFCALACESSTKGLQRRFLRRCQQASLFCLPCSISLSSLPIYSLTKQTLFGASHQLTCRLRSPTRLLANSQTWVCAHISCFAGTGHCTACFLSCLSSHQSRRAPAFVSSGANASAAPTCFVCNKVTHGQYGKAHPPMGLEFLPRLQLLRLIQKGGHPLKALFR